MKLLILRPEPGASATAERARALGLDAVKTPLFTIEPVPHEPPDRQRYDSVLLTSANAARHGPKGVTDLPCFAVGEATAAAARVAGYRDVRTGSSDAAAAMAMMAQAGVKRAYHPCGGDHVALEHPDVRVERQVVYQAEPADMVPGNLVGPAVAMVHSPRAGARLAELVEDKSSILVAAISLAAAEAAGEGWALTRIAQAPRDEALLELAARLCKYGA